MPKKGFEHREDSKKQMGETRKERIKKGIIKIWNKEKKGLQIGWNKGKKLHYDIWNKGLTKETDERVRKYSKPHPSHSKWMKTNNPMNNLESKKKLSKKRKGKNNPMYGKSGKLSPVWKEGVSFEPYSPDFNKKLKGKIKKRDNYICQLCGEKIIKQTKKKFLTVHHINYDKKDCREENLITLCNFCNSSVNFKRKDWIKHFQEKICQKN